LTDDELTEDVVEAKLPVGSIIDDEVRVFWVCGIMSREVAVILEVSLEWTMFTSTVAVRNA
jgi:uncharacterized protein YcsI (UPF0317 family)